MSEDMELLLDLPPEYVEYHDEGCEVFASCLECPLERCRIDEGLGESRLSKRLRDDEIAKQHRAEGKSIAELAASYGISRRTVQRILKKSESRRQYTEFRIQQGGRSALRR